MDKNENILSIKNLTINFGGLKALDDVFLDIAPNQVVAPVSYTHLTLPTSDLV